MAQAESEADVPEVREITRLLARLACNCHSICDNTLDATGIRLGSVANEGLESKFLTA